MCIPRVGCGDAFGSPEHPLHPNGSLVGCGGTYGPLSGLELGSLSGLGHSCPILQQTVGESLPVIRLSSEVFTRRAIVTWLSCWMWRCIWGAYVQRRTRTVLVYTIESTGAVRWSGGGNDHHHRALAGIGEDETPEPWSVTSGHNQAASPEGDRAATERGIPKKPTHPLRLNFSSVLFPYM